MTSEDYARIVEYSRSVAGEMPHDVDGLALDRRETVAVRAIRGHDGPPVIDRQHREVRMSYADFQDLRERMLASRDR